MKRLLFGASAPSAQDTQSQSRAFLEQLSALPEASRIAEAVKLALASGTDLTALAAALMPSEQHAVMNQVDARTEDKLIDAGFRPPHEGGVYEGLTMVPSSKVMRAMRACPFPESVAHEIKAYGLEGRINAVRQGRIGLSVEDQPEVQKCLEDLNKAQLKDLRDALVFKPPHPDLKNIRKLPSLKGAPTAEKLLSIFAGEGFEVTNATLPFETIFRPKTPVSVSRRSGEVETDWSIQARAPSGGIVVRKSNGDIKTVSREKLLGLNPGLIPLNTPVLNLRTSKKLDSGWHVSGFRADGKIKLRKPGATKPVTLQDLLRDNPELVAPPKVTGMASQIFAAGQTVTVTRNSGAVEDDWETGWFVPAKEEVLVSRGRLSKPIDADTFLADNLHLIPLGIELNMPRSAGWVEDGWQAFGHTDDGRVRMLSARGEWKAIPGEELIKLNRELLLRPEDVDAQRPKRSEVAVTDGPATDQALGFQSKNVVDANQIIRDGYFDGGRGQQLVDGKVTGTREVLRVDRSRDPKLRAMLAAARSLVSLSEADRIEALTRLVDQHFTAPDGDELAASERLGDQHRGKEVLLGNVAETAGGGVCRHRALLFKVLGDEAGLKVKLVRGYAKVGRSRYGGHAWNEVQLADGSGRMVDVMNPTRRGKRFVFPELKSSELRMKYQNASGGQLYE